MMEEIKIIKAEWCWGTRWHLYTENSMVQLGFYQAENKWFITGLWVNKGHREKGLAENLIRHIKGMVPRGENIHLSVEDNAPQWLRDFYKRKEFIIDN